jgi:hypothetical protein
MSTKFHSDLFIWTINEKLLIITYLKFSKGNEIDESLFIVTGSLWQTFIIIQYVM